MTTSQNSLIEPPWAGYGRSTINLLIWIFITFALIPIPLGAIFCGIWKLGVDKFSFTIAIIMYALGLLIGSIPFLKAMEKSCRLYIKVASQTATIITNDLPGSQERETSDSREETPLHGFKLGEGTHILNPLDQKFVTLPIEIDYQVNTEPFRVTIGKNHMRDLMVKGFTADFKTDSEHLLALARISTDDTERKTKIETRMRSFITRFIEEECKEQAKKKDDDGEFIDPSDKSDEISENVRLRLIKLLCSDYPGFELKSFTIGNIDKPDAVEKARDKAATVEQMTLAAENMLKLNKAEGAPDDSHLTPQEAIDTSLIAAGIKIATKEEKGLHIHSETVKALGDLAIALVKAFKS